MTDHHGIIVPRFSNDKKLDVLNNQNGKCAKKPYARISGLEGYKCSLWEKIAKQGKIIDDNYTIIKIDPDGKNTLDNLIALCNQCFNVMVRRRKTYRDSTYDSNESISEEDSDDSTSNSEVDDDNLTNNVSNMPPETSDNIPNTISNNTDKYKTLEFRGQWKIIFYPDRPGMINIYGLPNTSSEVIECAMYGDIIDSSEVVVNQLTNETEWVKITYGDKTGYVQLHLGEFKIIEPMHNGCQIERNLIRIDSLSSETNVSSVNAQSIANNTQPTSNNAKTECTICFNEITHRIALVPCGHMKFCSDCIDRLPNKKCPICTQKFRSYIKLFE
jgi:hypothetical protein